jgi:transcriptional regulator with XRE-family HTH domain
MESIPIALLKKRQEKNLTQQQVAERANVKQAQLSRFEHGSEVYLSTAAHIAEALDMRIIAVPKETILQIENLLHFSSAPTMHIEEQSLFDKYNIKDNEE